MEKKIISNMSEWYNKKFKRHTDLDQTDLDNQQKKYEIHFLKVPLHIGYKEIALETDVYYLDRDQMLKKVRETDLQIIENTDRMIGSFNFKNCVLTSLEPSYCSAIAMKIHSYCENMQPIDGRVFFSNEDFSSFETIVNSSSSTKPVDHVLLFDKQI